MIKQLISKLNNVPVSQMSGCTNRLWRRTICLVAALTTAFCVSYLSTISIAAAQDVPEITPEMIEAADAGDAYSAYIISYDLIVKGGEENIRTALRYLDIAYEGYSKAENDDERFAGSLLKMIGDGHGQLNNYAVALERYRAADKVFERFMHLDGVALERALNLQAQGLTMIDLSRYKESLTYFEAARALMIAGDGEDSVYLGDTYLNEGIALEGMKRYVGSIQTYNKAMLHYSKAYGPESAPVAYAINNIGWVFRRLDNFEEAENWTLKALPMIDRHEGAFSDNGGKVRINLGIIYHQMDRTDEAIRWTMRAMPYISANKSTTYDDQRWAFDTLSRAMRAKGDIDKAITFGKLAVNAQQAIRNQNADLGEAGTKELRSEWSRLYEHLASLLIEQGRIAEAQAVLNMEKEQEVFNFLRRDASASVANTTAILTDAELSEEERLKQLSEFPIEAAQTLFALTLKLEADTADDAEIEQIFVLQEALEASNATFEAQVEAFLESVEPTQTEGLTAQFDKIESYQALLEDKGQKAAILQIAAIDDKAHLFLTLPNLNLHKEVNVKKADLAKLVFDSLQLIEQRSPDASAKLQELNDILFAPVREALDKSETEVVMLNLNGFLRYVPFAALFDGEEYLVQNFAFSLYTTTIPTQFSEGARERTKTAGFGVTAAHPGFSPLPGVRQELEIIFSGDDAQGVLEGPTALDASFDEKSLKLALLKKPSILHIASHFNLKPGQEDDSFLLLGDGAHLKLSDIRKQRALSFKGIDLVTLSACQTALGGGDGSEIEGFGAAAQANGAGAVMASLWPVADDATPILMRDFYHAMIDQGLTKAEALRIAQVSMLTGNQAPQLLANLERGVSGRQKKKAPEASQATFAHPYFWSPFVLMGNWL